MTLQSYPLLQSVQGVANSAGTVTLQLGPVIANESWTIEDTAGSNPGPRVPSLALYKNYIAQAGYVDSTLGAILCSTDKTIKLQAAEVLYAVWTLCTAGTLCTITVRGTRWVNG